MSIAPIKRRFKVHLIYIRCRWEELGVYATRAEAERAAWPEL